MITKLIIQTSRCCTAYLVVLYFYFNVNLKWWEPNKMYVTWYDAYSALGQDEMSLNENFSYINVGKI